MSKMHPTILLDAIADNITTYYIRSVELAKSKVCATKVSFPRKSSTMSVFYNFIRF